MYVTMTLTISIFFSGVLYNNNVPRSNRERDGADSDIQNERHAQQHEHFSSEP